MNKERLAQQYAIKKFGFSANTIDDVRDAFLAGFDAATTPLIEVLKKVNLAIQHSNMKDTILHVEIKEAIKKATTTPPTE